MTEHEGWAAEEVQAALTVANARLRDALRESGKWQRIAQGLEAKTQEQLRAIKDLQIEIGRLAIGAPVYQGAPEQCASCGHSMMGWDEGWYCQCGEFHSGDNWHPEDCICSARQAAAPIIDSKVHRQLIEVLCRIAGDYYDSGITFETIQRACAVLKTAGRHVTTEPQVQEESPAT